MNVCLDYKTLCRLLADKILQVQDYIPLIIKKSFGNYPVVLQTGKIIVNVTQGFINEFFLAF